MVFSSSIKVPQDETESKDYRLNWQHFPGRGSRVTFIHNYHHVKGKQGVNPGHWQLWPYGGRKDLSFMPSLTLFSLSLSLSLSLSFYYVLLSTSFKYKNWERHKDSNDSLNRLDILILILAPIVSYYYVCVCVSISWVAFQVCTCVRSSFMNLLLKRE